jgi:hypothetical protein
MTEKEELTKLNDWLIETQMPAANNIIQNLRAQNAHLMKLVRDCHIDAFTAGATYERLLEHDNFSSAVGEVARWNEWSAQHPILSEEANARESQYQPTSNPCVFLKGRELFQRKDDGSFEPFVYENRSEA